MVGTGRGAQLGVIIKGGEVLEDTRAVDVVVLDKTGTVTEGRMELTDVVAPHADASVVLRLVASAEARSGHPIAEAISAAVPDHAPVEQFENRPGFGVVATVEARRSGLAGVRCSTPWTPPSRTPPPPPRPPGPRLCSLGAVATPRPYWWWPIE